MGLLCNIDPDYAAIPQVTVTIYPYEIDTVVTFSGTAFKSVLTLNTSCGVNQENMFSLTMAPEDLSSILSKLGAEAFTSNSANDITSIITPMSLISITASRGSQQVVPIFFGLVREVMESETISEDKVTRYIIIKGTDLSYYLRNFAYFTLTFLGASSGLSLSLGGEAGTLTNQLGLTQVTPAQAGTNFLNKVIMPYLQNTQLNLENSVVNWGQLIQFAFQDLPVVSGTPNLQFPFLPDFLVTEGSWWDKFQTFFPVPVYENFFMVYPTLASLELFGAADRNQPILASAGIPTPTSPAGVIPALLKDNVQSILVSRPMPFPRLIATGPAGTKGPLQIDRTAWDGLIQYTFETTNPIVQSTIGFSIEEARSFFILNPTMMTTLLGAANPASHAFLISGNYPTTAFDPISLAKFGYRPYTFVTDWFADGAGLASSTNAFSTLGLLLQNILLYIVSYFVPLPLMAKGTVKIPFSPWVIAGNKINLHPFKNAPSKEWTFYIERVDHTFVFGEESSTTLTLSRGLPTEIYENNTALLQLLSGLVERANNDYQLILDPEVAGSTGVTFVSPANATAIFNSILPGFAQQQPTPPSVP